MGDLKTSLQTQNATVDNYMKQKRYDNLSSSLPPTMISAMANKSIAKDVEIERGPLAEKTTPKRLSVRDNRPVGEAPAPSQVKNKDEAMLPVQNASTTSSSGQAGYYSRCSVAIIVVLAAMQCSGHVVLLGDLERTTIMFVILL